MIGHMDLPNGDYNGSYISMRVSLQRVASSAVPCAANLPSLHPQSAATICPVPPSTSPTAPLRSLSTAPLHTASLAMPSYPEIPSLPYSSARERRPHISATPQRLLRSVGPSPSPLSPRACR